MGLFADMIWRDGRWVSTPAPDRSEVRDDGTSQLAISIYDSDYATVDFVSRAGARGKFYLGFEPADYFDDPRASERVDPEHEAEAFADWARHATGRSVEATSVLELMAMPGRTPGDDPFVETVVANLLTLVGLEEPDWYG